MKGIIKGQISFVSNLDESVFDYTDGTMTIEDATFIKDKIIATVSYELELEDFRYDKRSNCAKFDINAGQWYPKEYDSDISVLYDVNFAKDIFDALSSIDANIHALELKVSEIMVHINGMDVNVPVSQKFVA